MEVSTRVSARRKRTQGERRADMRRQLMEATVACLSEDGYHGTTTLAVERRAGVSRGARVHHFATKAELLAGAADYLLDQIAARYDEAFGVGADAASRRARVHRGLALLWSLHRRPEYVALVELSVASRGDDALREHLSEVGKRQRHIAAVAIAQYFPALAGDLAVTLVDTVHAAMVGTLLRRFVNPETIDEHAVLQHLETLVMAHLPPDDADGDVPC